jgi:hypothetical protein
VATAADTPPGRYEGTLTLTANGQPTTLPVTIEVLPIAFPPAPFTWYSYASVPYWYHAGSPAWRAAFTALMRNEAEHGATMVSIAPAITCQGDPPTFDFTLVDWQLDTADALYREAGRPPPRYYQYAPRKLPPSDDARFQRAYAEALTPRLRAAGRWERFYLKVGDEPGDIVAWGKLAAPYRAGGLQTTTAHATRYDLAPVVGTMSAWCPNYEHDLELPLLRERQAAGDPFWWYICTVPSTRITGQPVDTLPFYWLTALWRLDGGHSYAALSPPDGGPEGTGVPFRYDHGLAWRILFLPDGTLLDSTRREYEAEAIRDAELLRLAGERGAALAAPLIPGKYRYTRDAAAWSAVRQQLYDLAAAPRGF